MRGALAIAATGLLFAGVSAAAPAGLEPGPVEVRREIRWAESSGWPWWFVASRGDDLHFRSIAGRGFAVRAVVSGSGESVLIWLPQLDGNSSSSEFIVRSMASDDLTVVALLPPRVAVSPPVKSPEWLGLLEARVRSSRAAIREFAPPGGCAVVAGMSLGAVAAIPAAALEPTVDGVVLMLGGAGIESMAVAAANLDPRLGIENEPLSASGLARIARLEAKRWSDRWEPKDVLIVDASFDRVVPQASRELLWRAMGQPTRITYPTGHRSFGIALPFALQAAADHVERVCSR